MVEDTLYPKHITLPKHTKAVRDTLAAQIGTIIYDTNANALCYCISSAPGSTSWRYVISSTTENY